MGLPVVPEVYTSMQMSCGETASGASIGLALAIDSLKPVQPDSVPPTSNLWRTSGASPAASRATSSRDVWVTNAEAPALFNIYAASSRL